MKEFQIKKLINGKGFYCKIKYDFLDRPGGERSLQVVANSKWTYACEFAHRYFLERYPMDNAGFQLVIREIDQQIVDTNSIVILYAIVTILVNETGFVLKDFELNVDGCLVMPK